MMSHFVTLNVTLCHSLLTLQDLKEEIERVNLEVAQAEREYDLNRAAELKYGTSLELNKQLKVCGKLGHMCIPLVVLWGVHVWGVCTLV